MKNLIFCLILLNVVQAFGSLMGKSELPNNGTVGEVTDKNFPKESLIADYMVVLVYQDWW